MAKKRRRRAAKKRATKKTTTRRRRKSAARASAAPRRKRSGARKARKSRKKVAIARAVVSNPRRRRKKRNPGLRAAKANPRRRRRRNPGMFSNLPTWASAAVAGVVGIASYAVANAGSFALTQRVDPSMETLLRNRTIAGLLFVAGGAFVAIKAKSPTMKLVGGGIAAAGAINSLGSQASVLLGRALDSPGVAGLGAVLRAGEPIPQLGAVEPASAYGMGAIAHQPPWTYSDPFYG